MTIADPEAIDRMAVEDAEFWQVGVWADSDEVVGTVDTSLVASGHSDMGLDVTVRGCTEPWEHETCAGTEVSVRQPGHVVNGSALPLLDGIPTDEERWFLFEVHIPRHVGPDAGDALALRVVAEGLGEYVTGGPTTPTPTVPVPTSSMPPVHSHPGDGEPGAPDPAATVSPGAGGDHPDGGLGPAEGSASAAGELPYTGAEALRVLGPALGAIGVGLLLAFLAGVRRRR